MQALTALYSVNHGACANNGRSTSQTCPKCCKVPSASPVANTTGDPTPGKLLLGCVQASTPVCETSADESSGIHFQSYKQSLVISVPRSWKSSPTNNPSSEVLDIRVLRSNANRNLDSVQPQPQRDWNTSVTTTSDDGEVVRRTLIRTLDSGRNIMSSIISMPGSPPELTESRSSKSSSYGSHFSVENDLSTEITNFEDIGLQDDINSDNGTGDHGSPKQAKNGGRRDTYYTRQSSLAEIKQQPRTRMVECAGRPTGFASIKRGFTSPSVVPVVNHDNRTRSSSPPKRFVRSTSTSSLTAGSIARIPSRPPNPHSRRGSLQPQRKTIKEIEAEYHDSDDELPDDATLWNVPISPFHSTNASPQSSLRGSLDRTVSVTEVQPLPLEHVKSAPIFSRRNASFSGASTRLHLTPRSSTTVVPRGTPTSPTSPTFSPDNRPKSWNVAMSDLSAEARIITQNLEHHVDISKMEKGRSSKLISGASHRGSTPSAIQLPPVQKGPLDFMPISKEKEAVLSRTRPSWLPPKDPKEEQRHLREYQRMMAASIEAEKKKETLYKNFQTQQDKTIESVNRIWDFYINPTTDITAIDRRVHDLCWRGIPTRVRGQVWQRTVGNSLGLTAKTYHKALERARNVKAKNMEDCTLLERSIDSWLSDIDRDAETAFPELGFFQRDGPLWHDLVNVCEAYTCYRSDIGYVYGLQLIAALILLQIPSPSEAFVFMANCLNKPAALAFHTGDIAATQANYRRVVTNLGIKFPKLHDYLFESSETGGLGLTGQELLEPMFRTLFSNGLDFDRLCRVWDIWIFQGDRSLTRTAVAILGSLQTQIFEVSGDSELKKRNVQEMLGWGPFNRTERGGYWKLDSVGTTEAFLDEVNAAGKLDYTGH